MENRNRKPKIVVKIPYDTESCTDGLDIWCPDIPGVCAWGKNEELARKHFDQALRRHISSLVENEHARPRFIEKQIQRQVNVLISETIIQRRRRTFTDSQTN